jgi:hypothetical protein
MRNGIEMLMPMEKDPVFRLLMRRIPARWIESGSQSYGRAFVDREVNNERLTVTS